MAKVIGAFLLGVLVTVAAARLLTANDTKAPAASASCQPEVEDLTNPRGLDARLDGIESEISGEAPKR